MSLSEALPASIGPYRFLRRIGAGGMGEVFLADDQRLGRQVAIKRVRHDRTEDEHRLRLRREARAIARMSHPAIIQVFDLLETPDADWIVMEYVPGPRLADLMCQGPLDLQQVLTWGSQVAEGLAEAHGKGIVHRDLKAENILIAGGRARILDFGLVRHLAPGEDEDSLTRSDAVLGTLRTMAPEQAKGHPAGPRADLFSLGVLLYEMVNGTSPFRGASTAETIHRILGHHQDPLPPETPAELARLISQLLEKAPELRPEHAAEVARRLAELIHGRDSQPPQLTGSGESTEFSLTNKHPQPEKASVGRQWFALRQVLLPLLLSAAVAALLLWLLQGETAPASRVETSADLEASPTPSPELQRQAQEALARSDLPGNTDLAIESFLRLLEINPDSAENHAGLARAYWQKLRQDSGDRMWLDQSLRVARRAVELDPNLVTARISLALGLISAGHSDEALVEVRRALELDPQYADAYRALAELHYRAGDHTAAEEACSRAIELAPEDATLYDLAGTIYFRAGRMEEAATTFRKSIELAPDGAHGYRNLAGVFLAQGHLEEASKMLERGLRVQPSPSLYLNQGTLFFFQGLYTQAAEAYEKALEFPMGANRHASWSNLGDAYRQIPHRKVDAPACFERAIQLLRSRLKEDTKGDRLLSLLALYHAKAGQRAEAVELLESIVATDPRQQFRHVVAWEVLGERDRALEALEKALSAGFPSHEIEREPELLALRADPRYHRSMATLEQH